MNNENNSTENTNTFEFKTVNPLENNTASTSAASNTSGTATSSTESTTSVSNTVSSDVSNSTPTVNSQPAEVKVEAPVINQPTPVAANVDKPNTPTINNTPTADNTTNADTSGDSNYKPPGKIKTFFFILLFGGVLAFVIFLPEIQAYVAEMRNGGNQSEEITSGRLICTLDTNTDKIDKNIERIFKFTDKKLVSAKFTTTTKGDVTEDATTLDELANQCNTIKESVSSLSGINVSCEYSEGKLIERESFEYDKYDIEKIKTAYTEAGGDVIEYEYGYDIDKIMTSMRQSGFDCSKEK